MFSSDGVRPHPVSAQAGPMDRSERYQEWVKSNPATGEALVDTGLSSASDCQKLRWSLGEDQQNQFAELLARSVMHDRELFKTGRLEAEARRINDVARSELKAAGFDPAVFGVSTPEQLSTGPVTACGPRQPGSG